jgi:hypothetical protein
MSVLNRAAFTLVLLSSVAAAPAFAQDPPALTISPDQATLLVGETHTFRAVGRDGRMRHNVRWGISPEQAASLTVDGEEAIVEAKQLSSSVLVTAYSEGDSGNATVEIRSGETLATGTRKWSVAEIPGCKDVKITPAVPSAGGPDIYVQEACPQGTFVRALTDDGRELWRREIGRPGTALPVAAGARADMTGGEHLNRHATSLCDAISAGMTKQEVSKLISSRLRLDDKQDDKQQESNTWVLEEEGFRCTISFDGKTAAVVKKKKTIVTD